MAFSSRDGRRRILLGLLMVALAGCQTRGLRPLTGEQEKIRNELAEISPWEDSLAKKSPLIDKNYFFGNALRYLNAKTRLDDTRRPVAAAVQNRLEQALALSSE